MKIKKGQRLLIICPRKGTYFAKAIKDFDTSKPDSFAPIVVDQDEPIDGLTQSWFCGDEIPCRCDSASISKAN